MDITNGPMTESQRNARSKKAFLLLVISATTAIEFLLKVKKVFILTSVEDGDIYLLCDKCYRKWVMESFEKGLDGFTDDIFNDGR